MDVFDRTENVHDRVQRLQVIDTTTTTFADFWPRYQAYAASMVKASVRSNDVEDVMQEIAMRLWRAAPRYNPALGSTKSWVYRVIKGTITDHIRRSYVRARFETGGRVHPDTKAPAPREQPDDAYGMVMRLARKGTRDALLLVYGRGMTVPVAAMVLGQCVGTVKSSLSRGRQQIRERMPSG